MTTTGRRPGELPVPGAVIARMRRYAFAHPWRGNVPLLDRRHVLDTDAITEPGRPTRVLVSFDYGYHASGWFKNSDYEQCLHVSVSHPRTDRPLVPKVDKVGQLGPAGTSYAGLDLDAPSDSELRAWGVAFFAECAPMSWLEPPCSPLDPYRQPGVGHLRLYYDRQGLPFMPEGEPYLLKPWKDGTSPAKVTEGAAGGDVR